MGKARLFTCDKPEEIIHVAKSILDKFPDAKKFAFRGELGSGKTAFIKAFCSLLGIRENVDSPTYTLMNVYDGPPETAHFDFYRINGFEEALDIGSEEFFSGDGYVFVEWAEKVEPLITTDFLNIEITVDQDGKKRLLKIE